MQKEKDRVLVSTARIRRAAPKRGVNDMIDLKFDIAPVPKGRPRMGRNAVYTPARTRRFESAVRLMARAQYQGEPLKGPIWMDAEFVFVPPKSVRKEKRPYPTVKPDIDNLVKTMDALNGVVYNDDCQIVAVYATKVYDWRTGARPRIRVTIGEIV